MVYHLLYYRMLLKETIIWYWQQYAVLCVVSMLFHYSITINNIKIALIAIIRSIYWSFVDTSLQAIGMFNIIDITIALTTPNSLFAVWPAPNPNTILWLSFLIETISVEINDSSYWRLSLNRNREWILETMKQKKRWNQVNNEMMFKWNISNEYDKRFQKQMESTKTDYMILLWDWNE